MFRFLYLTFDHESKLFQDILSLNWLRMKLPDFILTRIESGSLIWAWLQLSWIEPDFEVLGFVHYLQLSTDYNQSVSSRIWTSSTNRFNNNCGANMFKGWFMRSCSNFTFNKNPVIEVLFSNWKIEYYRHHQSTVSNVKKIEKKRFIQLFYWKKKKMLFSCM